MFRSKSAAKILLVAISLGLLAPLGQAEAAKLKSRDLQFHSTVGQGYNQGDSLYVFRGTGLEASAEQADTTASFSSVEWILPGALYPTITASDTVAWLRVSIYPDGGAPTTGADTADVRMQVSETGTDWTNVVWTGPKISPDVASMGAAAWLETGTTNTFVGVIRQVIGGAGQSVFNPSGTGAPTSNQVYGYPLIRFIISGDFTGRYRVKLTGFVPESDD